MPRARDAEHAGGMREGRGHVVSVADIGNPASAALTAPVLEQGEQVSERLTGMLLVGERVDHVHLERCAGYGLYFALRVGPDDQRMYPSLEVARHILERFARTSGEFGGNGEVSPPSSRTAISNVDRVRSEGFEQQGDVMPRVAEAVGASDPRWRSLSSVPPVPVAVEVEGPRSRMTGSPWRRCVGLGSIHRHSTHFSRDGPWNAKSRSRTTRNFSCLRDSVSS